MPRSPVAFPGPFGWERAVDWALGMRHPPRAFAVLNFLLASEPLIQMVATALLIGAGYVTGWAAGALVTAVLVSPHVETWCKTTLQRGRPRDPHEWGIPSGDCMMVALWTPHAFGGWAWAPILYICLARIIRRAHWTLDTLVGVGLGLLLGLPAMVLR